MEKIVEFILGGFCVLLVSYLFPGVYVNSFVTACLVAFILSLLNSFIKPILNFLAFPINIITLGLFKFVINAIILNIVTIIMYPDFYIRSFSLTIIVSIVLSILYSLLGLRYD